MPKAKPETCPHPVRKWRTAPSFGHTLCTRCDADITPAVRAFKVRAGERTTFEQGDRVHVRAYGTNPAYKGTFQWAEGDWAVICEKQLYKDGEGKNARTVEGTAAIRHVPLEHIRHDAGVRARRRREEELV